MRSILTALCLRLIQRLNRHKDRCLATKLNDLARDYDPETRKGSKYVILRRHNREN